MNTRESSTARASHSTQSAQEGGGETVTPLPDLTTTTAGEPLLYLSTPDPVISSAILTIPRGGVSRWMIHPVPAYVYILQGDLTVEFIDGKKKHSTRAKSSCSPGRYGTVGATKDSAHFVS